MIRRKSAYTFTAFGTFGMHMFCLFFCMREKPYEKNTYHHKLAQLKYLRELVAHAADGSQNNTDQQEAHWAHLTINHKIWQYSLLMRSHLSFRCLAFTWVIWPLEKSNTSSLRSFRMIMLFWQRLSLVRLAPTMSLINVGQCFGHSCFRI